MFAQDFLSIKSNKNVLQYAQVHSISTLTLK